MIEAGSPEAQLLDTVVGGAGPVGLFAVMAYFWVKSEFRSLREAIKATAARVEKLEDAQ